MSTVLHKADIDRLIPHAGEMVLIDRVLGWSENDLSAEAELRHTSPLADAGELPAAALVEYAGQCMAIHGGLQSQAPKPAVISVVKQVEFAALVIDEGLAQIDVERLHEDAMGASYRFEVRQNEVSLASGEVSIMFMDLL